jgi:formylmethanofuran dehydrogenase subunit E
MKNSANHYSVPTVSQDTANAAQTFIYPDPPKVITFPVPCESWVGHCDSCGYAVYSGDDFAMQDDRPVCPECVADQAQWFVHAVKKAA